MKFLIKNLKLPKEISLLKIDAFANIFVSRYLFSMFIWLLVFLTSCAACTYLIASSVREYKESKVTSTIRYINEQKAVLPTLTFCNLDPFTTVFALNLLAKANLSNIIDENPVDYWRLYLHLEDFLNTTRGYFLTDEEKLELANYNVSVIPTFNGDDNIMKKFERIFHPKYFGCLRYNSKGDHTTTGSVLR